MLTQQQASSASVEVQGGLWIEAVKRDKPHEGQAHKECLARGIRARQHFFGKTVDLRKMQCYSGGLRCLKVRHKSVMNFRQWVVQVDEVRKSKK